MKAGHDKTVILMSSHAKAQVQAMIQWWRVGTDDDNRASHEPREIDGIPLPNGFKAMSADQFDDFESQLITGAADRETRNIVVNLAQIEACTQCQPPTPCELIREVNAHVGRLANMLGMTHVFRARAVPASRLGR